ncbi:hypothetical protein CF336_g2050 [Tilletia laevis]|nr:hypothetical protein CF336_g2050 [Tilletia laevis]KAE8201552.1 hypothetical protein CF328_g2647 [Tilletia controversa]
MAGFGARRMQEEQQREADRRQQEWERAEAERRHVEFMQQQEIDRQNVEIEKQRLAWEWSELQRQQREHEDRRLQFQHEQAYVAEQQRLQNEQEQQRIYQQQQQQFLEQQHRLEQQQEALAQQQKELAEQQQAHNEAILEKQRKLKKTEVELQRKLRSQQAEAQKLQEELQQQKQLTQQQLQLQSQLEEERRQQQQELEKQQHQLQQQQELEKRQHQLQQKQEVERRRHQLLQKQEAERRRQQALQNEIDGDDTLEAITASPARGEVDRPQPPPKKSPHRGQAAPLTIKFSEQRTQAWAAEHAETMLAWCGDCRQDVLLTQLGNHHCMRRNNSSNSSQDSSRTTELVRPSGLSAHARTPSPSAQPRSPFFERHLELERSRGTNSPLSPALSPIWPDFHNNGRLGSNEGPLIRRTPSEDERERLISTPSPIPPDLSPEEEADIRAERKRRIEAQREAKKKGTTVVAATAIMAALKFENLARAAVPSRSMSPPSMSATVRVDNNSRMPHDKFPSNSSLASTQASSLLSAAPKYPFQRDRAYSGSSAVITPSTSYAFSAGATSSPDLVPSSASRMRTASSASQNRSAANRAAVGASSSGLRTRMDSAGAARVGRSRLDSDPAAKSRLHVDTTAAAVTAVQQVTGRKRLESGKRLDPLDGLGTHRLPGPALAFSDAEFVDSPVEQSRSKGLSPVKASRSRSGNNGSGGDVPASSSSLEPIAAKHLASRSRSNSVSPLATRRPSLDDREASRKGTGAGASTGKVDLRGIEDLMRGLETDVAPGTKGDPRRVRERSNSGRGVQKMSTGAGPEELSPIRNARTGGTTPRPLKAGDRLRS